MGGGTVLTRGRQLARSLRAVAPPVAGAVAGRPSPLPLGRWLAAVTLTPAPRQPISAGDPSNGAGRLFHRGRPPSRALPPVASAMAQNQRHPRLRPPTANPLAPIGLDGADSRPVAAGRLDSS